MEVWALAEVRPATMLVFMLGGAAFILAVLTKRLWLARAEAGEAADGVAAVQQPARHDRVSLLGVAAQMVGIGLASGPARIVGSGPLDGLDAPRTWIAALTIGGAVALFVWAAREMGVNWSIEARTRGDHRLVTSGPFAWVRNPIYLAMLLFLLSLAAATGHERALPLALPIFALGTWIRIRSEEALLRAQFGAEFEAYAARVKRFLPGLV